jgi:hypothetical protein
LFYKEACLWKLQLSHHQLKEEVMADIVICIPEQQTGKLTSCVAMSAMGMYKPLFKQKLNSVFQEL